MGEGEISESTVGLRAKPALSYEADYPLRDGSTEAPTVGLGRYERDTSLDQYYRLLGPLEHFTRAEPAAAGRRVY